MSTKKVRSKTTNELSKLSTTERAMCYLFLDGNLKPFGDPKQPGISGIYRPNDKSQLLLVHSYEKRGRLVSEVLGKRDASSRSLLSDFRKMSPKAKQLDAGVEAMAKLLKQPITRIPVNCV